MASINAADFATATAVKAEGAHSYSADFALQWCYGSGK